MKYCSAPWTTAHINYLGQLSSCFCGILHKKGNIGSAVYHPIKELYNSESQKEFRNSIINQSFNYCREDTCVDYYRMTELDQIPNDPNELYLPTTLQLQIDPVCNLKCEICRTKNIYSTEPRAMAVRILNRLIEEYQSFEHKVNVHCDGIGEVFVSAAYLDFFAREDLPKCLHFSIQTNGNLLTKNVDIIQKIQPRLEMVEISLDAGTEETYKRTRGGNFNIVLDGIRMLKQMGIPVWTQYIVQEANYREILQYVKLCKELGVDKICLQLLNWAHHMNEEWWNKNSIEVASADAKNELVSMLEELKKDPQIEISGGLEHLIAQPILFKR